MKKNFELSIISDRFRNRMIVLIIDVNQLFAFNMVINHKNSRSIYSKKKSSYFMNQKFYHYSRDLPGIGFKPGKSSQNKVRIKKEEFTINDDETAKFIEEKMTSTKF